MRPIVFDQTIGWLHPVRGERGVVIAGAHGFEDLCSRQFLTLIARRLAEGGMPVLQFDYPGCGDAPGDHTAPGQVAGWIHSIAGAIDRLKSETGVRDVLVIGFRLGALLAPAAIAGRDDVAGLALLAPPASGRAYMRETIGLSRRVDAALPAYDGAAVEPFDGVVAGGFRLSAETVAALRALDWQDHLADRPDLDLLLMPPLIAEAHSRLAEGIRMAGGKAELVALDGFARLMSSPTANDIPLSTIEVVVQWAARPRKSLDRVQERVDAAPPFLAGDGYREHAVVIGPAPEICGVLCTPTIALPGTPVALVLNAGAVPHIGWGRGAVEMARTLARRGIASMRVDLPGLGQSGTPGEKRRFLYDERASGDVVRILDWLEKQGFEQVCAMGICAGAHQAFHTARRDRRISHLGMINPHCFSWNRAYGLSTSLSKFIRNHTRGPLVAETLGAEEAAAEDENASVSLLKSAFKFGKPFLRGSLEFAKSVLTRISGEGAMTRRPVEGWMKSITGRGTQVLMVSCEKDLSLREIARHFGPDGERLRRMEGGTMMLVPAADHTLTPIHARDMLTDRVIAMLSSAPAAPAGAVAKTLRPSDVFADGR